MNYNIVGLCAFDVVARYGNISVAAQALGLTQSALSQRIKNLEAQLETTLFKREHRGVVLTEEGRRLLVTIRPAMDSMRNTLSDLERKSGTPRVRLSIDYAFASYWLLPRLPQMRDDLYEIDLQILTSQTPVATASDDCELIIHMGQIGNMDEQDFLLMHERVIAVCSPSFKAENEITDCESLLSLPLLSLNRPRSAAWHNWQSWFQALNVVGLRTKGFTSFTNYNILIEAAIDGQGVTLGWLGLIESLLEKEALVQATDDVVSSRCAYILSKNYVTKSKEADLVHDWIVKQCRR